MPRRSYRTLDDLDIEDLGVFEYLDDETTRFIPAPPPARPKVVYDEAVVARLQLELPVLWLWVFLSCFFYEAWPWMFWGVGLIAVNLWLRPAFAQGRLNWLFRVYVAAGVGQFAVGLARLLHIDSVQPLLGFYLFVLMLIWLVLELRYQVYLPNERPPQTEDDQIYYFYG
jgi:hypothetical protein